MALTKKDLSGRSRILPWYGRRFATFLGLVAIFSICIPANAGDILRPGVGPAFTGAPGSAIGTTPTSASAQVRADAQSRLARTTAAIQAVQAMQNAARAAAISGPNNLGINPVHSQDPLPNVPNGLAPGALQVAPGATANSPLWQGANLPAQSTANGQTTVNIKQTQQKAILNWQTFNVGKNTTANFDQSAGGSSASSWVALNRVTDPNALPSQILGKITAQGQVYVLNLNGVLFGGSSQVNVGSLIAAAADMADSQLLATGIYSPQSGGVFQPSFVGGPGAVVVQAGAQIVTNRPAAVVNRGGYVMLLGNSVQNDGSIMTPDGQTILAAGNNFFLRPGFSVTQGSGGILSGNQTSTTLGTEVEVDKGGSAANTGFIEATTGDITMVGGQVTQAGVAIATSSVAQRGTIHLLTPINDPTTGLPDPTTSVTLAPGSLTLIEPDPNSGTALAAQRAAAYAEGTAYATDPGFNDEALLPDRVGLSRIEITTGGLVNFENNSLTIANGGQISVSSGGRIFAASGSWLDVSGLVDVTLPMSANILPVNIQGFELRDNPLNRDTKLLNNITAYVDIRQLVDVPKSSAYPQDRFYTPGGILEVSGELNNVGHTINEWLTVGGSITFSAQEVVAQPGSLFNIAGGSISYQGGFLKQTWLVGTDGRLYNINTAPTWMTYTGVYDGFKVDHPRWNITEDFFSPLIAPAQIFEPGYTVGRDGGSLLVYAQTSIFAGTIDAGTINGVHQNTVRPSTVTDPFLLAATTVPLDGSLVIGPYFYDSINAPQISTPQPFTSDVTFGTIDSPAANQLTATGSPPVSEANVNLFSASQLSNSVLGGLTVNVVAPSPGSTSTSGGHGLVKIADPLTFQDGAQISLTAGLADIAANIAARSGNVSVNTSSFFTTPSTGITLEPNVTVDTRGVWTNAHLDPANTAGEAFINGGSVTLVADQGITLAAGSLIDASSGGALLPNNKTLNGSGGNITIQTDVSSGQLNSNAPLVLAGALRSYGVKQGGGLTLQAYSVLIGDQLIQGAGPALQAHAVLIRDQLIAAASGAQPAQLQLPTSFFSQGFSSYTINGLTSLIVEPGASINVTEPVYQITTAASSAPTGSDPVAAFGPPVLFPVYVGNPVTATLAQRPGASLTLQSGVNAAQMPTSNAAGSGGAVGGTVDVGQSSVITVDPGQSVGIQSGGQITVDGAIHAPSGLISVVNNRSLGGAATQTQIPNYDPGALSIWLGSTSVLDVAARSATAVDQFGRPYGVVPNGGTIVLGSMAALSTNTSGPVISTDAFVIIRPSAQLDASGTAAVLDTTAGTGSAGPLQAASSNIHGGPVAVGSNGGTIAMTSYDGIYNDGTLRAVAGASGATGGTLSITLAGPSYSVSLPGGSSQVVVIPDSVQVPRIITVSQDAVPSGLPNQLQPGQTDPALVVGQATVAANTITQGGFDNLILTAANAILFKGNVNLRAGQSISLYDGTSLAESDANGQARVSAPYVLLANLASLAPLANFSVTGTPQPIGGVFGLVSGTAVLTVNADLIDLNGAQFGLSASIPEANGNSISLNEPAFAQVNFISQGDIRFFGGSNTSPSVTTSPGSLSFTAAQLYPESGAFATIIAGDLQNSSLPYVPGSNISIQRIGSTDPAVPLSVFGELDFEAETINQGGVVRAPLGFLSFGLQRSGSQLIQAVNLLPGSLTSVSANGLTIPYGGTTDGVTYTVNGTSVTSTSLVSGIASAAPALSLGGSFHGVPEGIAVTSFSLSGAKGAMLDLSGGGTLTGAAFISGRGGSVDVLSSPLVVANPANTFSSSGDQVYAIVPGAQNYAAPPGGTNGQYGGGVPGIGQQITVPSGIPGLAAGNYTLMPSNYALLPGAFRVELGGAGNTAIPNEALANGSYQINVFRAVANTPFQGLLPTLAIVTPGSIVRTYSQYNEENYSSYLLSNAARFNNPRPFLPADGKTLALTLMAPLDPTTVLSFDGVTNFSAAGGGVSGAMILQAAANPNSGSLNNPIEITGPNANPTPGWLSISAATIDAIGAPNLFIGGAFLDVGNFVSSGPLQIVTQTSLTSTGSGDIAIRTGAVLTGSQVVLIANGVTSTGAPSGSITIEPGAAISTLGGGKPDLDSSSGYFFTNGAVSVAAGAATTTTYPMLAVSNGYLNVISAPYLGGGAISVSDGASFYSNGSIAFATTGNLTLGEHVNYGAKYIGFSTANINIGTPASLAAAQAANVLPAGLLLDQGVLSDLLKGNPSVGAPALLQLTLSASQSVNLYGTVDLNTIDPVTGKSSLQLLAIETPALYGAGTAADRAIIQTGTLYWNGLAQSTVTSSGTGIQVTYTDSPPGLVIPNGPGTGTGLLDIVATRIVFGYSPNEQPQSQTALSRLALGFSQVTLTASQEITANNKGSVSVYLAQGSELGSYTGGNLNLVTPLLTGGSGSVMTYRTGGALNVIAPAGSTANAAAQTGLGAEIDLAGNTINIAAPIVAATGKIALTATGDIMLLSRLDVSGQVVPVFDQNVATWGGDITIESTQGNVVQAASSIINVSATGNDAGTITITADAPSVGDVSLGGTLVGTSSGSYNGGSLEVRAQNIGDFTAFNQKLDTGGFFGSRAFDIKQGDVTINAGTIIKAHEFTLSVDNGSLTVNGVIDASGRTPGTIRLGAQNDLTLGSSGLLDALGTILQVDSYGQPIEAKNKAVIELTTQQGTLTLAQNSRIDVRSPDGVARGEIELNTPRTGETSGDIKISAADPITIAGAGSIAVNAFWKYVPTDPNGTIVQDNGGTDPVGPNGFVGLNQIDLRSQAFINAAWANGALQNRLAGLQAYGTAFHLRPGVEIDSATPTGNLTVVGDLDLSRFRYGPTVNPSVYGSGEPGVLILRAGGTLAINGSINDGFAPPPSTPDDSQFLTLTAGTLHFNLLLPADASGSLDPGTLFVPGGILGFNVDLLAGTLPAGISVSQQLTLAQNYTIAPNTPLPLNYTTPTNMALGAGQPAPFNFSTSAAITLKTAWTPNLDVQIGSTQYGPDGIATVPAGTVIPAATSFSQGLVFVQTVTIPANTTVSQGSTSLIPINFTPGTIIPSGTALSDTVAINGGTPLVANVPIPIQVTLAQNYTLTSNLVAGGTIVTPTRTYQKGDTILAGSSLPVGTLIGPGVVLPFNAQVDSQTWPAGTPLDFAGSVTTYDSTPISPGQTIPAGTVIPSTQTPIASSATRQLWAVSPMLPAGAQSWSMRLVAGADLGAADTRVLIARSALNDSGNLVFYDPHLQSDVSVPAFSVVRTGTGSIDLLAGGNIDEDSPYGIYTAGTQAVNVSPAYNLPRGVQPDGTILNSNANPINPLYVSAIADYQAYYPDHGGDVLVSAQADVNTLDNSGYGGGVAPPTYAIANWLWRQGGKGQFLDQQAAWWINFGTYVFGEFAAAPVLAGFTGIGALGGGNVTILIGGSAGLTPPDSNNNGSSLVVAVGATGRVNPDNTLTETGGGDITIKVGGALNPPFQSSVSNNGLSGGEIINIRGNINLEAGSVGGIALVYGQASTTDPRPAATTSASTYSTAFGGPVIAPGDGSVNIRTRGDLVLGNAADPGRVNELNMTGVPFGPETADAESWFSLWTASTSISTLSAGGNVVPLVLSGAGTLNDGAAEQVSSPQIPNFYNSYLYPPTLRVFATAGSIYFGTGQVGTLNTLELAPASRGHLDMLAQGSIFANALIPATGIAAPLILDVSDANAGIASFPNPFSPAYYLLDSTQLSAISPVPVLDYNTSLNGSNTVTIPFQSPPQVSLVNSLPFFAFEADNATGALHLGSTASTHIYAATGDIVDLQLGESRSVVTVNGAGLSNPPVTWLIGGEQSEIRAGADIVNFGQSNTPVLGKYPSLIVNNSPNDVSVLSAGQDIIYANVDVAGPGLLEVSAGRNLLQGGLGVLESIGPIGAARTQSPTGGAGITVLVGVDPPDWSDFANLYLNPANLANPSGLLADQPGKVVKTYQDELYTWLRQRFGYAGNQANELSYFLSLPTEQQSVFLLQVYFAELNQSGLDYNDPSSRFFHSYIRGNEAIAALFPSEKNGQKINYQGDLTLATQSVALLDNTGAPTLGSVNEDGSILTDFGGAITTVVAGGQTIVGTTGLTPGPHAGILTQGSGDIDMYSLGSVLLGQSRVLTTFGGNIVIWSATGDINAGRGAKGTVIFSPPGINYDNYADITLAPTVPSSGAGIGTLAPIPGIPAGDLNLVAPLGTIDAGEAGIRSSGNANIAALQIVNAQNISVQGKTVGTPTIATPNVTAETAASTAAGSATSAANEVARNQAAQNQPQETPSIITVEVLGYGGGAG